MGDLSIASAIHRVGENIVALTHVRETQLSGCSPFHRPWSIGPPRPTAVALVSLILATEMASSVVGEDVEMNGVRPHGEQIRHLASLDWVALGGVVARTVGSRP